MSHRAVSMIECDHVDDDGTLCREHLMVDASQYDKDQVKARVARRMLLDEKTPWQLGVHGHLGGVAVKTLDFCPEHHVETTETFPGGKRRYDLHNIPYHEERK